MVATSLKLQEPPSDMEMNPQINVAQSYVDTTRLGLWCKTLITEGSRFGPFCGEKALEVSDDMDPAYMWEIVDVETKEFLFYINATDPKTSNWMRYINCVRFDTQPNIVSEQDGIDIYYRALRDILPGEELLTSTDGVNNKRRRGKPKNLLEIKRANISTLEEVRPVTAPTMPASKSRKSAITTTVTEANSVSQRGRKRVLKKYHAIDAVADTSEIPAEDARQSKEPKSSSSKSNVSINNSKSNVSINNSKSNVSINKSLPAKASSKLVKTNSTNITDAEKTSDDNNTQYFAFNLRLAQRAKNCKGRNIFQCIVCSSVYRQSHSLKRHFIKNHITLKYVNNADAIQCSVNTGRKEGALNSGENDNDSEDDESVVDGDSIVDESLPDTEKRDFEEQKIEDKVEPGTSCKKIELLIATEIKTEPTKPDVDDRISADDPVGKTDTLNLEVDEIPDVSSPSSNQSLISSLEEEEYMDEDGDEEEEVAFVGKEQILPGLYRCNICEDQFDRVEELGEHFVNHPATKTDKKYACAQCHMRFKTKQNLMRHEVVHTGAKLFVCSFCDKRFPTLANRRTHERSHKGQKLQCPKCPSTFTLAGDRKKHARKYHPETYQACAFCAKFYFSETELASHLMKLHGKNADSNNRQISARTKAHKESLALDEAESQRLAGIDAVDTSTLRFRCTDCVKKFEHYTDMCHHRRLVHGKGAPRLGLSAEGVRAEEDANDDVSVSSCKLTGSKKQDALQLYYSQISKRIADNLEKNLDGKTEQLSQASSHIIWKQQPKNVEATTKTENSGILDRTSCNIKWEEFNFPSGFHIRESSDVKEVVVNETSAIVSGEIFDTITTNDTGIIINNSIATSVPPQQTQGTDDTSSVHREVLRIPEIKSCTVCHAVFANSTSLDEHIAIKHSAISSETANCGTVSPLKQSDNITSNNETAKLSENHNTEYVTDASTSKINELLDQGDCGPTESVGGTNASESDTPMKKYMCLVCLREFQNQVDLYSHQNERHANIDCRHVEVDMGFKATWCQRPNSVGTLNVSSGQLPAESGDLCDATLLNLLCTKCKKSFPTRVALHQHIVDCGDYWRDLSQRISYVFVLRGIAITPTDKSTKKRGKFHHWSPGKTTPRRQTNSQQKGGSPAIGDPAVAPSSGSRRSMRALARQHSSDSPPGDEIHRPNQHATSNSPWRHIRRHQSIAVPVDTHKCDSCDEAFDTSLKLERHQPICSEKQRLEEHHATKDGAEDSYGNIDIDSTDEGGEDSFGDIDVDPTKHMCIYCRRQFAYLSVLRKHVAENCRRRRRLVALNYDIDLEWEQDIANKVLNGSGVAIVRRDLSQNFNEIDDVEGGSVDGRRGKFRRRRGNNWGSRQKTRRSLKTSDETDKPFGWEDAFMQGNKDANKKDTDLDSVVNRNLKQADSKPVIAEHEQVSLDIPVSKSVACTVSVTNELTNSAQLTALTNDLVNESVHKSQPKDKHINELNSRQTTNNQKMSEKVENKYSSRHLSSKLPDANDTEKRDAMKYSASDILSETVRQIDCEERGAGDNILCGGDSSRDGSASSHDEVRHESKHDNNEDKLKEMSSTPDGTDQTEATTKSRRRKGPRLTMRSKRRKTESNKSDKAVATDLDAV